MIQDGQIRGWISLAPMGTHSFLRDSYKNFTIPNYTFYRESDLSGKRLYQRDLGTRYYIQKAN